MLQAFLALVASLVAIDVDGHRLRLEPFQVLAPDVRIEVVGRPDRSIDLSRVELYRGDVEGQPGSTVFVAVRPGMATGRVELGPGAPTWRLTGTSLEDLDLVKDVDAEPDFPVDLCGADALHFPSPRGGGPCADGLKQVEVAIETDHAFYQLFGDEQEAIDYLVSLYGAVSDIYTRDASVRFDLTFIRLWPEPDDPYAAEPLNLNVFRTLWNDTMDDVDRDVAQMLSGRRDAPWGGVAYLPGRYSMCAYLLGFFETTSGPHVLNRDITLTAHELGHNLGTGHTHDYGLDDCDVVDNTPQRGTIMSYCSQTVSGNASNTDLRFHSFCASLIVEETSTRNAIACDCNANGIPDPEDISRGTSADVNGDGIPDECQDCDGDGVLDPEQIASGAPDLNENGIPDTCEPDCNGNGVPDDLDIADGVSLDLHGNFIPDECEPDCNANGISDYVEIVADMSLDVDRNAVLDACEDCDGDGVADLQALDGAWNVWVTTLHDHTLREFHAETGVAMRRASEEVVGDGHDVLVTPDRRILVTDHHAHRVVQFDAAGTVIGDLVGVGSGGLDGPTGMTISPSGTLLVCSHNTFEILEYDLDDGTFLGTFASTVDDPCHVVLFGPDGHLYVAVHSNQVLEFDESGSFVGTFVEASGNGGLSKPRGMVFRPDGTLLVTSLETNQVLAYDGATGDFVGQFQNGGTEDRLVLDEPWGIRIGPDGDVYVSTSHIHRLHQTNARLFKYDVDSGDLVRAFINGNDTDLYHPSAFAFMPGEATDCNRNHQPDACEILAGALPDANGNGRADDCESCLADFNADGVVDVFDLLDFLGAFESRTPFTDLDRDGEHSIFDVILFLAHFDGC